MNPFRKKSPAEEVVTQQLADTSRVSVLPAITSTSTVGPRAGEGEGISGGEGTGVPLDFWLDTAPATITSPTTPPRDNTLGGEVSGEGTGEGTGVVVDFWSDVVPASDTTTSPTSPHEPPPPSSSKTALKSSPPPVAPRRRRSQITHKKSPIPERAATPEPPAVDPFNPNPDTSSESDAEPPKIPPPPRQAPRSVSPINPFLKAADGGVPRSLDMSDLSATPGVQKAAGRQSLDVDAFKRLMLTGQSTPVPTPQLDSSSTDTSSVSRQSIFEPILETETPDIGALETETPRTSHEIDDDDGRPGRVRSSSGGQTRPKPPPPKPRSRGAPGGGRSPVASSTTITIPTSPPPPPPGRHAPIRPLTQIIPTGFVPPQSPALLSPTPNNATLQTPSPTSPPVSPATSLRKRIPPSPPLSRRHSVQKPNPRTSGELERPSTPSGGGKMKPPPPPIRRMKSVNNRPHERSQSLSVTTTSFPPPPPPPPGTGRSRSSTIGSAEATGEAISPTVSTPVSQSTWPMSRGQVEVVVQDEGDILVDLQKLQREVDELRGKYEGRKLDVGVTAGE